MKTIRLKDNIVKEIIPEYALPVEKWYGNGFAKQCVEVSDDVEIGMIYNLDTNSFTWPIPEVDKEVLINEKINAIERQQSFLEDCIAEMAGEVYS